MTTEQIALIVTLVVVIAAGIAAFIGMTKEFFKDNKVSEPWDITLVQHEVKVGEAEIATRKMIDDYNGQDDDSISVIVDQRITEKQKQRLLKSVRQLETTFEPLVGGLENRVVFTLVLSVSKNSCEVKKSTKVTNKESV